MTPADGFCSTSGPKTRGTRNSAVRSTPSTRMDVRMAGASSALWMPFGKAIPAVAPRSFGVFQRMASARNETIRATAAPVRAYLNGTGRSCLLPTPWAGSWGPSPVMWLATRKETSVSTGGPSGGSLHLHLKEQEVGVVHLDLVQAGLLVGVELHGHRLARLGVRLDLRVSRVDVQLTRPIRGHDELD